MLCGHILQIMDHRQIMETLQALARLHDRELNPMPGNFCSARLGLPSDLLWREPQGLLESVRMEMVRTRGDAEVCRRARRSVPNDLHK